MKRRLVIGISGASGVVYGIRLLEVLRNAPDLETHLILTTYGRLNIEIETGRDPAEIEALADVVHNPKDLTASLASGSFRCDGMVIAPCSMKTLSAIANSFADSLLVRAADVMLKERRRLVLVARETPLHVGHLKLMVQASEMGAIIFPPTPAFYNRPESLDQVIDHTAGRILDLFDLDLGLVERWQGRRK